VARTVPTSVLTALGFSAADDRTYRRLQSLSGRELGRIAAAMLRSPEELLADVDPLLRAGIVRIVGDVVVVEPPAEAVRIMVAAQAVHAQRLRRRLEGLTDAVGLLAAEDVPPLASGPDHAQPIEGEIVSIDDRSEIYAMVRDLVLNSRGDLLWLRPDQWSGPREDRMAALVGEALRPGGRASRAIYPLRATREAPGALEARAAAGEQVRVLPELPTRMLVVGDSHLVLPEPLGFADMPLTIVRQRSVVEAAALWFELLWDRAEAPTVAGRGARRDQRRFLLQQLSAGEQDEQIARRLGLSLRTVRRRVADLMTELGADTRFQAGVEAARRGWI
jgi:DNA-binding CsgD family transcriptional regulator